MADPGAVSAVFKSHFVDFWLFFKFYGEHEDDRPLFNNERLCLRINYNLYSFEVSVARG